MAQAPLIQSAANTPVISSNDKGNVRYRGSRVSLVLGQENLYLFGFKSKQKVREINLNSLIGAKCRKERGVTDFVWLDLFSYDFPQASCWNCCSTPLKLRSRERISLQFANSEAECVEWAKTIRSVMDNTPVVKTEAGLTGGRIPFASSRRFLIFVNPVSGKRTALREYEQKVKPMMSEAGAEVKLIVTQYANHAREYVRDFDPTMFDAVVTIGGDGMYYEVLNGIMSREDGLSILQSLPLFPIPGGTGNGLAKSILFETDEDYSVVNATFAALRGSPSPMDISVVQTKTLTHYSFLLLGWGLVSDIDILSETMRCLGEPRIYIAAVYFIARKRTYAGRISIYTGHTSDPSAAPLTELPPIDQPIPAGNGWEVIEGDFVLVWVVQTSHCTASMMTGPGVTMDDGLFTIYIIQGISRLSLAMLMLSFDNGGHRDHPLVKTYQTTAYRLEPLTEEGIFTLDGEVVEYGPIQGIIKPSMGKVLKVNK